MTPHGILAAGCALLDPFLLPRGFTLSPGMTGIGSGGPYAEAAYYRTGADGVLRRLSFSVRYALGLVTYQVGAAQLSHDTYVRAVSGGPGAYPGFGGEPLDGFRRLRADLEDHGATFLEGSAAVFAALAERAAARPTGFKGLSGRP